MGSSGVRIYDAAGAVKENCCEMRCEASKSEDRKLDRATFCGVKFSIWVGGSYGEWLRRAGGLLNSSLASRSAAFQHASGLKVGSGVLLLPPVEATAALVPILFPLFPSFFRD